MDSNARAVECAARGAQLNGLTNITTELNASGNYEHSGAYQLVLANPPYYANFQIARRFLLAGQESLKPGGRILLVTKSAGWYAEHMPNWFDELEIHEAKSYFLISGRKPEIDGLAKLRNRFSARLIVFAFEGVLPHGRTSERFHWRISPMIMPANEPIIPARRTKATVHWSVQCG